MHSRIEKEKCNKINYVTKKIQGKEKKYDITLNGYVL